MRVADLDTPVLLVDVDRMERNITRMADFARQSGVKLRPHVKTHKIPALAGRQLAAGANGITVAKLGEAEVMADAGITDILVCYPIVGADKLARLLRLARRARMTVALDSLAVAQGIAEVARSHGVPIHVMLEVDAGLNRCGLPPGEPAAEVAQQIAALPGTVFIGLLTHAGHAIRATTADERDAIGRYEGECVVVTRDRLESRGIRVQELSVGSTATVRVSGRVPGVSEIRPGTYIFNDFMQMNAGSATEDDCALTVLSTIVSRPARDRAVLDAGSKCLSSDFHLVTDRMSGYGLIKGSAGTVVSRLSEEHGVVALSDGQTFAIGDRVEIIPNHACAALNLFDELVGVRGGDVVETWPILARGKVR